MQRRHARDAGAAVLVVMLLSPLGFIAGAQTNAGQGVASLPSETQDPGETWLGVIVTEVLVSEGLPLLLAALSCGLFFAGVEVFDLWRERRAGEVARLHARIMTALQRDRLLKDLPVTPIVHPPLWGKSGGNDRTAWPDPDALASLRCPADRRAGGSQAHGCLPRRRPARHRSIPGGLGGVSRMRVVRVEFPAFDILGSA